MAIILKRKRNTYESTEVFLGGDNNNNTNHLSMSRHMFAASSDTAESLGTNERLTDGDSSRRPKRVRNFCLVAKRRRNASDSGNDGGVGEDPSPSEHHLQFFDDSLASAASHSSTASSRHPKSSSLASPSSLNSSLIEENQYDSYVSSGAPCCWNNYSCSSSSSGAKTSTTVVCVPKKHHDDVIKSGGIPSHSLHDCTSSPMSPLNSHGFFEDYSCIMSTVKCHYHDPSQMVSPLDDEEAFLHVDDDVSSGSLSDEDESHDDTHHGKKNFDASNERQGSAKRAHSNDFIQKDSINDIVSFLQDQFTMWNGMEEQEEIIRQSHSRLENRERLNVDSLL